MDTQMPVSNQVPDNLLFSSQFVITPRYNIPGMAKTATYRIKAKCCIRLSTNSKK